MSIILIFIIAAIFSFLGSIQLGPVNFAVIKATLEKGIRPALYIAIGGCIPELIYAWAAISTSEIKLLTQNLKILQWLVVPIFFTIGLINILKKDNPSSMDIGAKNLKSRGIVFGFFLALFNFQLLPFWFTIVIFLGSTQLLLPITYQTKISFTLGAAIGAFLLLYAIAYFTNKNKINIINALKKYNLNAIFGWLFLILAILQIINLIVKD
jgi:threonine/homoserine/homoserine lactone efflux protein